MTITLISELLGLLFLIVTALGFTRFADLGLTAKVHRIRFERQRAQRRRRRCRRRSSCCRCVAVVVAVAVAVLVAVAVAVGVPLVEVAVAVAVAVLVAVAVAVGVPLVEVAVAVAVAVLVAVAVAVGVPLVEVAVAVAVAVLVAVAVAVGVPLVEVAVAVAVAVLVAVAVAVAVLVAVALPLLSRSLLLFQSRSRWASECLRSQSLSPSASGTWSDRLPRSDRAPSGTRSVELFLLPRFATWNAFGVIGSRSTRYCRPPPGCPFESTAMPPVISAMPVPPSSVEKSNSLAAAPCDTSSSLANAARSEY